MTTSDTTLPGTPHPPEAQRRITAYWSTHAPAYDAHQVDRLQRPGARELWERVWSEVLPDRPVDILDVGTGSGNVAFLLAALGHRVTGIDLATGMLDEARRKSAATPRPPTFVEADAVEPPFAADSFDVVTARYVLWTLRETDLALRNWMSVLRPGGRLIAVDSPWYPDGVAAAHDTGTTSARQDDFRVAYTDEVLTQLPLAEAPGIAATARRLEAAGFADVTVDELPELFDFDRTHGVAPGHRVQMQYRLTARRP